MLKTMSVMSSTIHRLCRFLWPALAILLLAAKTPEKIPADAVGVDIPLHDPSGHAMDALHAALEQTRDGKGSTRMMFYGASHVASDTFTGTLRRMLQTKFGDAGHGFVLPAKPWRHYRHSDVNIDGTLTWWGDWVGKPDARADHLYGLAGVSISTSDPMNYGSVATTLDNEHGRAVGSFDVYYLGQPAGGSFDIRIDGKLVQHVDSSALIMEPRYATFRVPDGPHRLEVHPSGDGEVRLFGVALDRDVPGVVLDSLGVNGARASAHLIWDEALYNAHIARRNPHLLALAYGTNERGDDNDPIDAYEERLRSVLARARAAAPNASCLYIGPSDRPIALGKKRWGPRPRTAQLITVQKKVTAEFGCAFFDLVAFMGGEMSMLKWTRTDPAMASRDHVHLTRRGYNRVAEALYRAILRGFLPDQELLPHPEN